MKQAGIASVIAILIGCTAIVGAQTSPTQSGSPTPSTSTSTPRRAPAARADSTANEPQQIRLVGCIAPGADQTAAVGTTGKPSTARATYSQGSTTATTPGTSFVLNNASMSTESSGSSSATTRPTTGSPAVGGAPGAAGTPSTAGIASSNATSYMLQGSDLGSHVGQRVELMGTLIPASPTKRRSTRNSSASAVAGTSGATSDTDTPRVHVTSVRMLSATCAGGGTTNR